MLAWVQSVSYYLPWLAGPVEFVLAVAADGCEDSYGVEHVSVDLRVGECRYE